MAENDIYNNKERYERMVQDMDSKLDEKFREIQAEGVSYVVCKHFGLEARSFAYLGLKKASSEEILQNLEVIARTSKEIIEKILKKAKSEGKAPPLMLWFKIDEMMADV